MIYPPHHDVDAADKQSLGEWIVGLPWPSTPYEFFVLKRICDRFAGLGGFDIKTIKTLFPNGKLPVDGTAFGCLVSRNVEASRGA